MDCSFTRKQKTSFRTKNCIIKIESDLAHAGLNSDHVVAMASNRSIVLVF